MVEEISTHSEAYKWIDIEDPSEAELLEISARYHLHAYSLRDCLDPDHLPKRELMGEINFILSRLLTGDKNPKADSIQQMTNKIAVFQHPSFIITVHKEPISFLETLRKTKSGTCKSTNELALSIQQEVLQTYEQPALLLSEQVERMETMVFLKKVDHDMLEDLYYIRRKATVSHKLLLLSSDAINSLRENDPVAYQDLKDLHVKLLHLYNQIYEDVTNLLNVYLSISTQRTNDVVKVLTIFSAFFLPLTFIAGIYGMNFRHMPELGKTWGYPFSLAFMAVTSIAIYIWMKKKKWL